jgi:DNA-binding CsgD family transcriptional regulator
MTTQPTHPDASDAIEAERQRIASLIDAEVITPLALLLSQASLYEQTMSSNPAAQLVTSVLSGLIRQSLQKARDLQANLHPALLDTLGLEPALEALASQQARTTGLRVMLSGGRLRGRLSPPMERGLYRAAQALIELAFAHAGASLARLDLAQHAEAIRLTYSDDGHWHRSAQVEALAALRGLEALDGARVALTQTEAGLRVSVDCPTTPATQLTAREADILSLLVEGLSNKEIAARLGVSARTVNFHLDNLYAKFGVNNRTEAVVYALKHGLAHNPVK